MLKKTYRFTLNPLFYLVILSIIILSLASLLSVGRKPQETRTRAAGSATLSMIPYGGSLSLNTDMSLQLIIDSGTKKLTGVWLELRFDPTYLTVSQVSGNTIAFPVVSNQSVQDSTTNPGQKAAVFSAVNNSTDPTTYVSGSFIATTLTFHAITNTLPSGTTVYYTIRQMVDNDPDLTNRVVTTTPLTSIFYVGVAPPVNSPTPPAPTNTPVLTTPTPTSNATPTPIPPTFAGPTNSETCDLCGWCNRDYTPKPGNWDTCMACNYITPTPAGPPIARTGYSYTVLGCIQTNSASFVQQLLQIIIGAAGGIAFIAFLIGVGILMTSSGNPTRVRLGKDVLTSSLVGLAIILFAVFLLRVVGVDILRIPGIG